MPVMIPYMMVCSRMSAYGYRPVHNSHIATPNEYTSTRSLARLGSLRSSGAVHGSVPRCDVMPETNVARLPRCFDRPKSHTLHVSRAPLLAVSTLSHLRSKCTKRLLCRYAIPRATSSAHLARARALNVFFDDFPAATTPSPRGDSRVGRRLAASLGVSRVHVQQPSQ